MGTFWLALGVTIVLFVASILLHELGHLVFGRLTGYRLVMFRFFVCVFYRDGERWIVRVRRTGMPLNSQCLMVPNVSEDRFKFRDYFVGGVVVNVVIAVICFGIRVAVESESVVAVVLFGVGVLNVLFAVANAVPVSKDWMNDGWNVKEAMRSEVSRGDLYRVFRITGAQANGVTSAEMPAEWFEAPNGCPPDSTFGWVRVMMAGERLVAMGDREAAAAAYSSIAVDELSSYYAGNVLAELWYLRLAYNVGSQINLSEQPEVLRDYLKTKLPNAFRLKAALAVFVEHDLLQARAMVARARLALPGIGLAGAIAMEQAELDAFESQIRRMEPDVIVG